MSLQLLWEKRGITRQYPARMNGAAGRVIAALWDGRAASCMDGSLFPAVRKHRCPL